MLMLSLKHTNLMETETVVLVQNLVAEDFIKGICTAAQGVTIVILHDYERLL